MDASIPPAAPALTVRSLKVRAVDAPFSPPLQSAAGTLRSAPLVLIDLLTEQGVTGRSWFFAYTSAGLVPAAAMAASLGPLAAGQPLAPATLSRTLGARFRLLGTQGLVGMALAALDMAAWDAQARALGLPLARLLGARGDERIPAYASLRAWTAADLAEEAGQAVAAGFRAVKLKFGHPTLDAEREVFRAVQGAVGEGVDIFVDPNQVFTVPEATHRAHHYAEWGVGWLEEPVRADDLAGHAAIARSLAACASALIMPDAGKVGGVTGWMAAAALADAAGVPVSSHLFVEFSAHLLAATPGRHWLEWLDVARPILAAGSPELVDGNVVVPNAPGAGLEWDEAAVAQYVAQ